jgi:plastocyanin
VKSPCKIFEALLIAALAFAGCDKEDGRTAPSAANSSAQTASTTAAAAATGIGVLRGRVKYSGPKPVLNPTQRACHSGAMVMIPDETIMVNDSGELKNVIVFLKNSPAGGSPQPAPVVDQKDCVYIPHVVAAQTGQAIKFTSADPVLHNVHILPNPNGEYNQGIAKGDAKSYPVNSPAFIKTICDVHPWMSCRIGVFDHPYFAVTGDDGSFEIKNLPSGTYTLGVWHEKLGQATQEVTLTQDKPAEMTVTLAPRK